MPKRTLTTYRLRPTPPSSGQLMSNVSFYHHLTKDYSSLQQNKGQVANQEYCLWISAHCLWWIRDSVPGLEGYMWTRGLHR